MKLTLTCVCGNTETIGINVRRMEKYDEDTIYIDDLEGEKEKFTHEQSHPDEATICCTSCNRMINLSI